VSNDILDWHADHLHTNYHGLWDALTPLMGTMSRSWGRPLRASNAANCGTLLLVDLEDEYFPEEVCHTSAV